MSLRELYRSRSRSRSVEYLLTYNGHVELSRSKGAAPGIACTEADISGLRGVIIIEAEREMEDRKDA